MHHQSEVNLHVNGHRPQMPSATDVEVFVTSVRVTSYFFLSATSGHRQPTHLIFRQPEWERRTQADWPQALRRHTHFTYAHFQIQAFISSCLFSPNIQTLTDTGSICVVDVDISAGTCYVSSHIKQGRGKFTDSTLYLCRLNIQSSVRLLL